MVTDKKKKVDKKKKLTGALDRKPAKPLKKKSKKKRTALGGTPC